MVLLVILITTIACFTGAVATGGALQTAEVRVSSNALQLIEDIIKKEIHTNLMKMYLGLAPEYAASSCKQIAELKPEYNSGYYWIQGVSGAVGVYCEMETNNTFGQSGGWMRIANVDMRNNHSQCPPGLVYNVTEGRRLCRKPSLAPGCSSTTFSSQGVKFEKVCGKVIGYQYYTPYGFGPARSTPGINETYVDGVSLTHGSPRQHVWTFADAADETRFTDVTCPCLRPSHTFTGVIPGFVGEDYYCEAGSRTKAQRRYTTLTTLSGMVRGVRERMSAVKEDHGSVSSCLNQLRMTLRCMRVCTNSGNSDEDAVLEQIELYIQ